MPVADYAVELNTGILVYKECVLREIVTSKRKAALATVDEKVLSRFNSSTDGSGNPTFGGFPSRELGQEEWKLSEKTMVRYLEDNDSLSGFNAVLKGKVKQAIALGYINASDPRRSFACKYADDGGDLEAVYNGVPVGNYWDGFNAVADNPSCSVLFAADIGYNALTNQGAYELYKNRERLSWGNGIYDVAHYDENGFRYTDTPGGIVGAVALQSVESPYVQAQQADDINEMIDGLYLGVVNQVLTGSSKGLAGLTQGAASYMLQVVQKTGGDYVDATNNVVLSALQAALTQEIKYASEVGKTIQLFTSTNNQLTAKETQCFTTIQNAVCQAGTITSTACTGTSGGTLTFSKPPFAKTVIDAGTKALSNAAITRLNSSTPIQNRINGLITDLRANGSAAAQTQALASLAGIAPHDVTATNAESANQTVIAQQMSKLITDTFKNWESVDAPVGWCADSQGTKDKWTACWSGSGTCPTP